MSRPYRSCELSNTELEKQYIDGLGKWRRHLQPWDKDLRLKCLMGYRQSVLTRVNWENIDRNEIVRYLNGTLMEYGIIPLSMPEEQAFVDQVAIDATE